MSAPSRIRPAAAALLSLAAVVLAACGSEASAPGVAPDAAARGKPPAARELRALEEESSQLLDGGVAAFEKRLADLEGHPIVVNQWASWCTPCRREFPFFQSLADKYRGEVAFLGVDSQDARPDAEQFLEELPTPFPHYFDPDVEVARSFGGGRAWPTTAFYAANGELSFTHQGAYAREADLDDDIQRYALGG